MTPQPTKSKSFLALAPVWGTIIFVILYVVATLVYPGGSQVNKNSTGFSWTDNYWCNLLNVTAINGQHNPARNIAIADMFVLCLTLLSFWIVFTAQINIDRKLKMIVRVAGIITATTALFLFTGMDHDMITNLASFFGLIATAGILIALYKIKWLGLFAFGLLNIVLVGLNNYLYYTSEFIIYLPLIQKITFAAFLIWLCCITILLYRMRTKNGTLQPPSA